MTQKNLIFDCILVVLIFFIHALYIYIYIYHPQIVGKKIDFSKSSLIINVSYL